MENKVFEFDNFIISIEIEKLDKKPVLVIKDKREMEKEEPVTELKRDEDGNWKRVSISSRIAKGDRYKGMYLTTNDDIDKLIEAIEYYKENINES